MPDVQEVFRMATQKVRPDPGALERQLHGQRSHAVKRKVGVFALVAALAAAGIVVALASRSAPPETDIGDVGPVATPNVESDATVDLATGDVEPLPDSISGPDAEAHAYALSPDGSMLAFGRVSDDGTMQVFVSAIDGTDVRQATNDPVGADFPAWTPDGTSIAFEGYGDGDVRNIFLIDLGTGATRQVTHSDTDVFGTQVSPDGASVLYGGDRSGLRAAPLEGGKPRLLAGGGGDRGDAGGGSMSPDGRWLAFPFGEVGETGTLWVARGDGTDPRQLVDAFVECSRSSGWSPDSSTLVCTDQAEVFMIDVETGDTTTVAEAQSELGETPIWLDERTLLVDV